MNGSTLILISWLMIVSAIPRPKMRSPVHFLLIKVYFLLQSDVSILVATISTQLPKRAFSAPPGDEDPQYLFNS